MIDPIGRWLAVRVPPRPRRFDAAELPIVASGIGHLLPLIETVRRDTAIALATSERVCLVKQGSIVLSFPWSEFRARPDRIILSAGEEPTDTIQVDLDPSWFHMLAISGNHDQWLDALRRRGGTPGA